MVWLDPGPSHPAAAGLLRACKGLLRPESFQGGFAMLVYAYADHGMLLSVSPGQPPLLSH